MASYRVYRVTYLGAPRNHYGLFVETKADGSGTLIHVSVDIQAGMRYEQKPARRPEESATFVVKAVVGRVSADRYGAMQDVLQPEHQVHPPRQLHEIQQLALPPAAFQLPEPSSPLPLPHGPAADAPVLPSDGDGDGDGDGGITPDDTPDTPDDTPDDTPLALPFFAPAASLPRPLPSPQEIARHGVPLQEEQTGRRVVAVAGCFVVKYGRGVSLTEGENMLIARRALARQGLAHAVPRVFALFSADDAAAAPPVKYIVMEHVVGERLDALWPRLDAAAKARVARRLRRRLDALRSLPGPAYFGSLGRRPFEDSMFWSEPDPDGAVDAEGGPGVFHGPFDSHAGLVDALAAKCASITGLRHKARFHRRVLPRVLRCPGPAVFTHADVQPKNVLLTPDAEPVLLDWEAAGWYPAYWEYAAAVFACGAWADDWHESVAAMLDEHANEYAWFDMLRRELWS